MTHLCVPIFFRDLAQARRDIASAVEGGADLVELRVDELEDWNDLIAVLRDKLIPVIVTCRPTWEGGHSEHDRLTRVTLLAMAADEHAAYVDVELATIGGKEDTFREIASDRSKVPTKIILSSHDFDGRPARLYNILTEMNALPADVNKIVWSARSIRDNIEAFELLQKRGRPTIALCMGEAGAISRILAKKFGAFLTFASLSNESATAPGQVTLKDLKTRYRWDAIGAETKVYGVVAQPVMHSMSPAIHNAAFDATGFDGVYLPLLVEGSYESFKAFMESFLNFPALHLSGLSITIPHKENALKYLKSKGAEIEPLAGKIGAVNTILIQRRGDEMILKGINTDYAAILDSITSAMGITREKLKGVRVAVLGAGGTGRTAVAALTAYGASVIVYNRTKDRADALAAEFGATSADLSDISKHPFDVLINTTSVGMHPNIDASPLEGPGQILSGKTIVFDTVYNPMKTKLLSQAEKAGAKTIGGVEMFVRQAAAQFEAWTGIAGPRDVMRQVVENNLK